MKKIHKITDKRGVQYNPAKLPKTTPMINPVSWILINEWKYGFYIMGDILKGLERQTLLHISDNKIIECFRLVTLEKGKDII